MSPAHPGIGSLPGVDPLSAEAFHAFKRVMHLNRQLMIRASGPLGGHPAQVGCLMVLAHHGNLAQRELAEKLHISPATLTTMLQRMEAAGLIDRRADENDQRLTRVSLTDAGREQVKAHGAVHAENINLALSGLSEADRHELVRLLNVIADTVEKEIAG